VSVAKIDAENAVIYAKSWGKCSELTAFIAATHAVTTGIATMLVAHAARAGWRCCKTGFCAPNCDGAATEPLLLRFFMVGSRLKIRVSLVRFRLWPPFFKHLAQPVTRVVRRFCLRQWPIRGPTRAAAGHAPDLRREASRFCSTASRALSRSYLLGDCCTNECETGVKLLSVVTG